MSLTPSYKMVPKLHNFCRKCALPMYEPNKGFDYRCAKCHQKDEGWC